MELQPEVSSVKKEATDPVSGREMEILNGMQIKSIKDEFNSLGHTEIYIKPEVQEDESDFQEFLGTCHETYPNYDVAVKTDEPMIKIEPEDMFDDSLQDPLDVGSQNQNKAGEKEEESSESESTYEDHVQAEFKQSKNENHGCPVCHAIFPSKSHLHSHMLVHRLTKPFVCDVCGKIFQVRCKLKRHKLSHTDERSFSCGECNKTFKCNENLVLHKLVHTGEKPFVCKFCNKGFGSQSARRYHELTHTGEKPFSCDICKRSYRIKAHLLRHMSTHTEEKSYYCNICQKLFRSKSNLSQHENVMHNK